MARGETGSEGRRKSEREGGRRRGRGTENVPYEISNLLSREIERGKEWSSGRGLPGKGLETMEGYSSFLA